MDYKRDSNFNWCQIIFREFSRVIRYGLSEIGHKNVLKKFWYDIWSDLLPIGSNRLFHILYATYMKNIRTLSYRMLMKKIIILIHQLLYLRIAWLFWLKWKQSMEKYDKSVSPSSASGTFIFFIAGRLITVKLFVWNSG